MALSGSQEWRWREGDLYHTYTVQLNSGMLCRRHIDQLCDGVTGPSEEVVDYPLDWGGSNEPEQSVDSPDSVGGPDLTEPAETIQEQGDRPSTEILRLANSRVEDTYPTREHRPPPRYM